MNENKNFFSKIGMNYLILALSSIIFQMIVLNTAIIFNGNVIQDTNMLMIISSVSNYILPIPVLIYLMGKLESRKLEKRSLSSLRFLQYVCITITFMWIGNIAGFIITSLIGNAMSNEITNPIHHIIENSSVYTNLIIISIIAPIFEELFFRKLMIDRTIRYGAAISILLSATMFGLFHGNLSQFFYAFLIGGFFSYVYIKTGKIIYPIILHMIINLMGSVISPIFTQSFSNITAGNPLDIMVILIYIIVIFTAWLIGISAIVFNYDKIDLDEYKEIFLEKPAKTVLFNAGMMLFIIFHIAIILRSLNVIHF